MRVHHCLNMFLAMLLCGCGSDSSKPASDEVTKSSKPAQVENDPKANDVDGQVTFLVKGMTERLSIF